MDDEPLLLHLVTRMLEDGGYAVITSSTAIEALDRLSSLGRRPDLLLTDVRMDPVDGASLARLARHAYPGLPVLLMSGYIPDAETLPGPFLTKPFTYEQLLSAVESLLTSPGFGRRAAAADSIHGSFTPRP